MKNATMNHVGCWRKTAIALTLTILTTVQPIFTLTVHAQTNHSLQPAASATQETVERNTKQAGLSLAGRLGLNANQLVVTKPAQPFENNPVDESAARNSTVRPDVVGTLSVENFQGMQSNLSWTHESAAGFRDYLANWSQPNYAKQDAEVSVWSYNDVAGGDNYDLWSSGGIDYGIDGVLAVWHSGHGGMSALNTFFAPMGANWGGRGWNAFSTNMRIGGNNNSFGDERLRYLFWDTCNSVMVSGGHDPYSTWGTRANGARMVFGYETTSIDSPNYGKFFWEEWNKGKSLTYSHLDSSWRVNPYQSPAVVAFGATSAEATARLDNERYLNWGAVSSNWAAWRWYYALSLAGKLLLPEKLAVYQTINKGNADDQLATIANRIGIEINDQNTVQQRSFNMRAVETDALSLIVEEDGDFELTIKKDSVPQTAKDTADAALIQEAKNIVDQYELSDNQEFRVGSIRYLNQSAGSAAAQEAAKIIEKTVVLNQTLNGLAFTDPDAGQLEITFDAETGAVKRLRSSLRTVTDSAIKQKTFAPRLTIEAAREAALNDYAKSTQVSDISTLEIVPDSESIGYRVIEGKITPVYRALIVNSNYSLNRPYEAIIALL